MNDKTNERLIKGLQIGILIILFIFASFVAFRFGYQKTTDVLQPAAEALVSAETTTSIDTTNSTLYLQGQIQELKDENEYLSGQVEAYKQLAEVADQNAEDAMKQLNELQNKPAEKIYIYGRP